MNNYWRWVRANYIRLRSGNWEPVHDWEEGADGVTRCSYCGKVYDWW